MKKIALTFAFSILTVFALFISTPQNSVQASELELENVVLQNDSIFVSSYITFNTFPPYQYYYNDGKYQGYIVRILYEIVDGKYLALYQGDVYRNAPIKHKLNPIVE